MTAATPFRPRRPSPGLAALLAAGLSLPPGLVLAQTEPGGGAASLSIPLVGVLGTAASQGSQAAGTPAAVGDMIPLPPSIAAARIQAGGDGAIALGTSAAVEEPETGEARAVLAAALWPVDGSRVTDGDVLLHGERDSLAFGLHVPPGADMRRLTIRAVSSAFILPGRSMLRAYVGDVLIGEAVLESITDPETLAFDLPAGIIQPGYRVIRLEADLTHRLYCGADAAYDLWTRIDLSGSGLGLQGVPTGGDAGAFLASVSVARAAGRPIVIRSDGDHSPTEGQLAHVTRELAAAIGGGLRFVVGDAGAPPDPASPAVEIRRGSVTGVSFRTGSGGSQLVEVSTSGNELPPLFAAARPDPRPATVMLPRDEAVPIGQLGFRTARIADNLWTKRVAFALPADWLTAVKKRATLDLDFGYLAGMPAGSELRIWVNGTVVRLIPLDRGSRLDSPPLEVRFDAGLLQPGRNLLRFEVSLPGAPADQPCIAAGDGRIEIRDTSALTVPSSPSMHMPGLASWMSMDGPAEIVTGSSADPGQVAERLGLVHDLGAALGRGTAATNTGDAPRRLIVLRPSELSRTAFGDFGLGSQVMLAALRPPRPTLDVSSARVPVDVVEAGVLGNMPAALSERAGEALAGLRRLALPDPVSELAAWLSAASGQAILFQLDAASPLDAYLLLADDARPEAVAAALEGAAQWGVPLAGHLALLDRDGAWSTWTDRTRLPVLGGEVTRRNWQDVVGNFASSRPRVFVGALLALAALSVLLANSYLAASRRQR